MGTLGEQLQAALQRAQERAQPNGKQTPEGMALSLLRDELKGLLHSPEPAPKQKYDRVASGRALGNTKLEVPFSATPFSFWLMRAKPGDSYIMMSESGKILTAANCFTSVTAAGKVATYESCSVFRGTAKRPILTPSLVITIVDPDAPVEKADDGESVHSVGSEHKSNSNTGGVPGRLQGDGSAPSPRQGRKS